MHLRELGVRVQPVCPEIWFKLVPVTSIHLFFFTEGIAKVRKGGHMLLSEP
jgi:hypothetical protein